jgi:hypothetical protein
MKTLFGIILGSSALLLAVSSQSARAADANAKLSSTIDGTWRWNFTMPDGTTTKPRLNLVTVDGKLTGRTRFRSGTETSITNVTLKGDDLRFQVIRERDGREIVTTYTGKWSGKTIKGRVESNWAVEKQGYDWEATRAHEGVSGTWKWTGTFRNRKFDIRIDLEQEGETLTGSMPIFGRGGPRRIEIKNGSVKDGKVYFETERGTGEDKIVTKYSATQNGDVLKGTIETLIDGEEQKADWDARRSD